MNILQLPHEIVSDVLRHLSTPLDIVNFGRTCHEAYAIISPSNITLWKSAWLLNFDEPNEIPTVDSLISSSITIRDELPRSSPEDWNYYAKIRDWTAALRVLKEDWDGEIPSIFTSSADPPDLSQDRSENRLISTLLEILLYAKANPTQNDLRAGRSPLTDDRNLSYNLRHFPPNFDFSPPLDSLIRGVPRSLRSISATDRKYSATSSSWLGSFRGTISRPAPRTLARQEWDKVIRPATACRLHALAGLTNYEESDSRALGRARRIVYDWDLTDVTTGWGPFQQDGSGDVDWRRVEAIVSVVTKQFAVTINGRLTLPQGFCFGIPNRTLIDPTVPEDWAGASGMWCGTYVFLNWENLVRFNMRANPDRGRPHDTFGAPGDLEDGPESCGGLMKLELKMEPGLSTDPKLIPDLPYYEKVPPVYFAGLSKSYDFQMTTAIRGVACLARDGRSVRWRYIVHYSGSDQWQLEGVQPGGIRSGCVYGLWTSASHEEGGPVGPFMYAPEALCKPTSVVPLR